jgi:hypothetical protein
MINTLPNIFSKFPYSSEFQNLVEEKSTNFVGREFIFTAINDFLQHYNRGYFTIVGSPGSGKSAILAKYAQENFSAVYYSVQVPRKSCANDFLKFVCSYLVETLGMIYSSETLDDDVEGNWLLSLLLQKISDRLEPSQKFIIAIDGLDAIDCSCQPLGSNLFYLPRYLPQGIYFLLTRRPFLKDKSGLLIEAPSQIIDLADYPNLNLQDIELYIPKNLYYLFPHKEEKSNFMYVSQIINAIKEGFYTEPFQLNQLPPSLEAYYQQHWQKMQSYGLSDVASGVLGVLTSTEIGKGISAEEIADRIDQDEFDVEKVLENWTEFLVEKNLQGNVQYRFYHTSFRDWLSKEGKR